jgi:hypothetical protein
MLPEFTLTARADTAWMFDFDNNRWFYYDADQGRMLDHGPTKKNRVEGGLRRRI